MDSDSAAEDIALDAIKLTAKEAAELETLLGRNPADIQSRIKLLGKYFHREVPGENTRRASHILWFIENQPDHPILRTPFAHIDDILDPEFAKASGLWRKQTESSRNKNVLHNAALFFFHADKPTAETFLSQALQIDPSDSEVESNLALLYSLWEGHDEQAFHAQLKVCQDPSAPDYFWKLTDLPRLAFATSNFTKADECARELLALADDRRDDWNYGNAINEAHTVLGLLALRDNNTRLAGYHLELSIQNIATPQTTSFGPDLSLAEELTAAGEFEPVRAYLDQFDRLAGPGHENAFELRFKMMGGEETPAENSDRLQFETALVAHELAVLEGPRYARQQEHLSEAIEKATRLCRTWARRVKDAQTKSNPELIARALARKELYEGHLKDLEGLKRKP